MTGRTTETLYADGSYNQSFYNGQGQLVEQIDPDGLIILNQYNGKGELSYTAADLNQNGVIDFGGTDRITQTTNDVTADHGTVVRRSRNFVWTKNGSDLSSLTSVIENSVDGLQSWQIKYTSASTSITNSMQTSYASPNRTVTTTAPDGSYTVASYSYGRLVSSTMYDSTRVQIGSTAYAYDTHARKYQATDARNGTTTFGFNNADQIATNTTPIPGSGYSAETTTTFYDAMLRPYSIAQPDGTIVSSVYLLTGELGMRYGSRTYPVGYSYDYVGRMKTMTNWSNFSGLSGIRVTTWNYDGYRGFLTNKAYADGKGPVYAYTQAGRLQTRAWVRGVTTIYGYDTAGNMNAISYSDGTPSVTYAYDRLGRQSSISWNSITDTLSYNLASQLLGESYSGGLMNSLSVTNGYDGIQRRTNLAVLNSPSSTISSTAYGYDNASRLSTVSDGTNNAVYSYLANSPLVSQITFKQNSTTRMTAFKSYDCLNRLTQISSVPSAAHTLPVGFNYNYNSANQPMRATLADGGYWIYGYDSLGQVTSGCKYFANGIPVPGQQFDYTFDTIGNRRQTMSGGDTNGANLRVANYTNNTLNQITGRDVPSYLDIMGASIFTNAVTINGQLAYRNQEYYRQQLTADNSASALWTNIIVSGGQSVTGNVYMAREPEVFSYDADGNLTNDGHWSYAWDAENRLVGMLVNTNVGPQYQLTFAYDPKGRRIQKLVVSNSVAIYTNRFLYDGWNLSAVLNPQSSILESYVWGVDLSGSMQGGGGVGGLLEVSHAGSSMTNYFPSYDGNGNVVALIQTMDGTLVANYEYGPFGEVIRTTGPLAKANPLRFSTKYQDDESDLLYYGYRYYKGSTGNWVSRDPVDERGFQANRTIELIPVFMPNVSRLNRVNAVRGAMDQYAFCENVPVINIDVYGLSCANPCDYVQGDTSAVVCCGGQMFPCVKVPPYKHNAMAIKIITLCLVTHELTHYPDVKPCNACGNYRDIYKNPADNDASECRAFSAELNCYLSTINSCNGDPECKAEVIGMIESAYDATRTYCKTPPARPPWTYPGE
jgi:RHS repeat-associated protein